MISKNSYIMASRTLRDSSDFNELYINIREQKVLQTLHKTLHSLCISLILRTLLCVGFEAKILHKPCIEPYILEHELNTILG